MKKQTLFYALITLLTSTLWGQAIELDQNQTGMATAPLYPKAGSEQKLQNLGLPVNSSRDEYTPFISPNGQLLFFQSNRSGGYGGHDLWYSINKSYLQPENDGQWTLPRNLALPVNTAGFEGMPALLFAPDGSPRELYFTAGGVERPNLGKTDLYRSFYQNGKWSEPENLIQLNSPYHDRMPSVSADGQRLYFSSDRPGGMGKSDIYFAERLSDNAGWSKPIPLSQVNTAANEYCPSIHTNNHTLYFSSDRPGGQGGTDIYFAHKSGNNWMGAQAMAAPVNSPYDDEYPTVTSGGMWLYFSSDRPGGLGYFDVYRSPLPKEALPATYVRFEGLVLDGDPSLPYERSLNATVTITGGDEPIVAGLQANNVINAASKNFSFVLPADRTYQVEITYPNYQTIKTTLNYKGVMKNGLVDRHKFIMYPMGQLASNSSIPKLSGSGIQVLGKVLDKVTGQPIPVAEVVYSFNGVAPTSLTVNSQGEFSFSIGAGQAGKNLHMTTSSAGYQTQNNIIQSGLLKGPEQIIIVKLQKAAVPEKINGDDGSNNDVTVDCSLDKALPRVQFNYNSMQIQTGYAKYLLKVAKCLKENSGHGVVIAGHTDQTGGFKYNMWLSWMRAFQAYKFLNEQGIAKERLLLKHYGETSPLVKNATTAAQRAENRRVEFAWFKLGTVKVPTTLVPPKKPITQKKFYQKKKKKTYKKLPSPNTKDYIIEDDPVADDVEVF